ncbi:LLM class flavin-dependent oxidoreductase [Geodermatophilus sabuli]|uniref:LLM class flavin-dependent oxidoreductase n=1 Tax=Geodermatophilus sabuli TaxID=1564158 RepID=A0A7K3VXW4_9ACTN|nr:LLM class flavin-dependent oxidoreductase [Geodermatophilus sabuli]NEK56467.1 LLM class flavin-dependent oxidoreductase [Geodermatophilus sabuli]
MRVALSLSTDQTRTVPEARDAETAGFDAVASGEHLFFHGPIGNAFVTLAAAAGATSRIRLVSSLTILPVYPAALAVKLATTLDQVSGGRFELGVGIGGEFPAEFTAAGVDPATRGARADEALELARRLWSGGPVTFDGRFTSVPGLELAPGPVQAGGPPIWLGGRSDAAVRRAGRFADHWLPYMYTPEQLASSLVRVREEAERAGRDPRSVRGAVFCWGAVDEDRARGRELAIRGVSDAYQQDFTGLADRYLLLGTPDDVVARATEYAQAGADSLVFQPVHGSVREAVVASFAADVLPRLHALRDTGPELPRRS